jgi:streptomycin 3"-adenylyltransferase
VVRPDLAAPGDRDLLMHYAVCRAAGLAVLGPLPSDLIGPIQRPAILAYLADELAWGLASAGESYAVLNACRARAYLADDVIISKIAGGEAALRRGSGPARVISRALAQQRGQRPDRPPGPDAIEFVVATAAVLRSGS